MSYSTVVKIATYERLTRRGQLRTKKNVPLSSLWCWLQSDQLMDIPAGSSRLSSTYVRGSPGSLVNRDAHVVLVPGVLLTAAEQEV